MLMSIVTITLSPAVDVNTAAAVVEPEAKIRCSAPTLEPGGGGVNVARAIHKLGGAATAVIVAGGHTGRLLTDLVEAEGIRCVPVESGAEARENLNVYEEKSGLQYRFVMPGPTLDADAARKVIDAIRTLEPKPAFVVASGSLPPGLEDDFYATLRDAVVAAGARLILDTSGNALRQALGPGVFLAKPNIREFRDLVGDDATGERLTRAAVEMIRAGKAEALLISLGAAGALFADSNGARRMVAPTVPIQSKVGAGDSTVAGLVLALARGMSLEDAARFGVAAGAAAVMTPGTELCRREDAERLFGEMKAFA